MRAALLGRKGRRAAIVVHDGRGWHVQTFSHARRDWVPVASRGFPGANPRQLPEEVLSFAVEHGARRVRLLLSGELHEARVALPEDMEPDEAHTAVAYEVAEGAGVDPHEARLAMARADVFRMGGDADHILAAVFERGQLEAYDAACRARGLRFDGAGSLELALLNFHARCAAESRCLLLRWTSAFYVTPASVRGPFAAQTLPLAFSEADAAGHPERYERARRRFAAEAGLPVDVWTLDALDPARDALVRDALGVEAEVRPHAFHEHAADMSRHAAWAPRAGRLTSGCALAERPEPPRDPHRAGTWLFLAIVVGTGLLVGGLYLDGKRGIAEARARAAAWETLEQARQDLDRRAQTLRQARDRSMATAALLTDGRRMPEGLLALLDTLRRRMPAYTRLTRIHEDGAGALVIEGTTWHQAGLNQLSRDLTEALRKEDRVVGTVNITDSGSRGELAFVCRIGKAEGDG